MIYNQIIELPILKEKRISLSIKREDLIHPLISGNKYRKLKYNIERLKRSKENTILTFGGAYSNHIAATAYAGKLHGIRTIGVIRGDELKEIWQDNPTLLNASRNGMEFAFVSREDYRVDKRSGLLKRLREEFGDFFLLPEGGTNVLAVKGCEEILKEKDKDFDVISCAVGTGGTLAGIINSAGAKQSILGFPILKGDFLKEDICKFVENTNWKLCPDYHFGGYAKVNINLINFINEVNRTNSLPLDPIYTGKMIFGLIDLISKDYFKPNTKILAIHTGGLQGIKGMNQYLENKNLPLISI
ncbi:MAG: pyridoxal-phosphate dependent enzyme [Eudoraea sp.]